MEDILASLGTLRDVRVWALVQSQYTVDNSNKISIENLLNVVRLVNDFLLDLSCKLKTKEFLISSTNNQSRCLHVSTVSTERNHNMWNPQILEEDLSPAPKRSRTNETVKDCFVNKEGEDVECVMSVWAWVRALGSIVEDNSRAATVHDAEKTQIRLNELLKSKATQGMIHFLDKHVCPA